MDNRKRRNFLERDKRRSSKKTVAWLGYDAKRDKGKFTARLRRELQAKTLPVAKTPTISTSIKVGAINVNGLSLDSGWAMEQIIHQYGLKVLSTMLKSLM